MQEAPPAVQCALGASSAHPLGHLTCPSRPGTEQCRPSPHRTGSDGRQTVCSTAVLINLPVLQEKPHCPELLQLQSIKLLHSLLSTYPIKVFLNPRVMQKMNSPELLERIVTPMTGWGTSISLAMLRKRPMPVAISASCSLSTARSASWGAALKLPAMSNLPVAGRKQSRCWHYRRQWLWDLLFSSGLCSSSHPIAVT